MKNEDKNQILYEKAKREWEQSSNDVDPGKTNKEYLMNGKKNLMTRYLQGRTNDLAKKRKKSGKRSLPAHAVRKK